MVYMYYKFYRKIYSFGSIFIREANQRFSLCGFFTVLTVDQTLGSPLVCCYILLPLKLESPTELWIALAYYKQRQKDDKYEQQ